MNKCFNPKTLLAIAAMLALPLAQAAAMTRADYQAGKTRISTDYKADKSACAAQAGNAKAMAGDAKASCMDAAKRKFGKT